MQEEGSPSGTSGTITLFVIDEPGKFVVDFDSPSKGRNKCNLSGSIQGLKFKRLCFTGPKGNVASCAMVIENDVV